MMRGKSLSLGRYGEVSCSKKFCDSLPMRSTWFQVSGSTRPRKARFMFSMAKIQVLMAAATSVQQKFGEKIHLKMFLDISKRTTLQ